MQLLGVLGVGIVVSCGGVVIGAGRGPLLSHISHFLASFSKNNPNYFQHRLAGIETCISSTALRRIAIGLFYLYKS
jgi:hypothetical protein